MELAVILIISVIPGLLWVWFFYRQDRHDKEPIGLIFKVFFAGMLAVIPAAIWESPFQSLLVHPPNMITRFLTAFLVVGVGEEALKLLAVYFTAYRHQAFNEPADGIVYAVTASLGFASLENALYTLAYGLSVAPIRAVITCLAHASFGGVAGVHLGLAKMGMDDEGPAIAKGLMLAALLHGLYDFFIVSRIVHPFFSFAIVFVTYRYVATRLREFPVT